MTARTTWPAHAAARWLRRTGRAHIEDGLEAEGRALLRWADEAAETEEGFRALIVAELWWDPSMVNEAVREVRGRA